MNSFTLSHKLSIIIIGCAPQILDSLQSLAEFPQLSSCGLILGRRAFGFVQRPRYISTSLPRAIMSPKDPIGAKGMRGSKELWLKSYRDGTTVYEASRTIRTVQPSMSKFGSERRKERLVLQCFRPRQCA